MNLLPLENKIMIKKEYLRRVFVLFGTFFSLVVFSGILLILPTFYLLNNMKDDYEKQLSSYKERMDSVNSSGTFKIVSDLNKKINILKKEQVNLALNLVIEKIINYKNNNIIIKKISYEKVLFKEKDKKDVIVKEKIKIDGFSLTRSDFLNFLNLIKEDKDFSNVNSPVSNLLKVNNVDFSITLEF
ncbi:MAG: hypothetical protein AAB491_00150 [Patescibacteria group bacterium]